MKWEDDTSEDACHCTGSPGAKAKLLQLESAHGLHHEFDITRGWSTTVTGTVRQSKPHRTAAQHCIGVVYVLGVRHSTQGVDQRPGIGQLSHGHSAFPHRSLLSQDMVSKDITSKGSSSALWSSCSFRRCSAEQVSSSCIPVILQRNTTSATSLCLGSGVALVRCGPKAWHWIAIPLELCHGPLIPAHVQEGSDKQRLKQCTFALLLLQVLLSKASFQLLHLCYAAAQHCIGDFFVLGVRHCIGPVWSKGLALHRYPIGAMSCAMATQHFLAGRYPSTCSKSVRQARLK